MPLYLVYTCKWLEIKEGWLIFKENLNTQAVSFASNLSELLNVKRNYFVPSSILNKHLTLFGEVDYGTKCQKMVLVENVMFILKICTRVLNLLLVWMVPHLIL